MNTSTLRIVTVNGGSFAFSIDNDGKQDGQCSYSGYLGESWNQILDYVRKRIPGFRCTLDVVTEIGRLDPVSGNYSGILGKLFTKEADITGAPVYYPLPDSDSEMEYSRPVTEDVMHILSFYNKTDLDLTQKKDILFMFDPIPIALWIGLLCSFLAFIAVLRLGHRLIDRKERSDAAWITTCAFLYQDNFPTHRKYILLLSLIISIGIFFAVNYLTNSVGTDLVVIEKPLVIESYDDIISRNITLASCSVLEENDKFFEAPIGSKERTMSQNHYLMTVGKIDPTFTPRFFEQKVIIVARKMVTEGVGYFYMTKLSVPYPNSRALLVKDPEAKKYTSYVPMRKDFDPFLRCAITSVYTRQFEAGLNAHILDTASYHIMESLFGMTRSQSRLVDKVVDMPHADFAPVSIDNIHEFTKSYLMMISIALTALISELMKQKSKDFKKKLLELKEDVIEFFDDSRVTTYWTVVKSDWYK